MDFFMLSVVGIALIGQLVTARSPLDWTVAAVTAVLGIVGYFFFRTSQYNRAMNKLLDATADLPWSQAAEFARAKKGAPVEANGKVVVRTPLSGPFSGETTAFWLCRVEELQSGGWTVIHQAHSTDELELEGEGRKIAVLPENAHVRLSNAPYIWTQPTGDPKLPTHLGEYVYNRKLTTPDSGKVLRFTEWRASDGDELSVLGRIEPVSGGRGIDAGLYSLDGAYWISSDSVRRRFKPSGTDRYMLGLGLMALSAVIGLGAGYHGYKVLQKVRPGRSVESSDEMR
jgi:hypothetical protein